MVVITEVVTTAYSIIKFIIQWKSDYEDANGALKALFATVELVQGTLTSLDPAKHPSLNTPMQALVDCLNETKDVLVANSSKKGFLKKIMFPSSAQKKAGDLTTDIQRLVQIMTLNVAAANLNQYDRKEATQAAIPSALDFLKHEETKKFWKEFFGTAVFAVSWPELEKALNANYPDFIDSDMLCDLHLLLDNLNFNSISCHRLSEFCGSEPLSRRLSEYKEKAKATPTSAPPPSPQSDHVFYPLLLWVDDNPENNFTEHEHAKKRGVCVVALNSTAAAKQWIINHPDVMDIEEEHKIHFITDNAREGKDTVLDINAGEDMIRFVRGRRSPAPILVYCGDLNYTKYVSKYKGCRAVNKRVECIAFIDELHK